VCSLFECLCIELCMSRDTLYPLGDVGKKKFQQVSSLVHEPLTDGKVWSKGEGAGHNEILAWIWKKSKSLRSGTTTKAQQLPLPLQHVFFHVTVLITHLRPLISSFLCSGTIVQCFVIVHDTCGWDT
jgi:hypothetical protein